MQFWQRSLGLVLPYCIYDDKFVDNFVQSSCMERAEMHDLHAISMTSGGGFCLIFLLVSSLTSGLDFEMWGLHQNFNF